ncbi:MAG: hypothetical protein ACYSUR_07830 [Planctomycetota bacterium]|jgi:hypothetical protein
MNHARAVTTALLVAGLVPGGCGIERLIGGMAQNYEYQKLIEVHPRYPDLENKVVAVLVDVDMGTLYEHPDVMLTIATNVAREIQINVPGARVIAPDYIAEWQFRTPMWNAMPYGEIADSIGVDRVVHIDLYEYRLHPPGNRWLWEGVCAASVGIIERGGLDPDSYADVFNVESSYPPLKGVGRDSANADLIRTGLLALFVERTAWLFYTHLEPKHPDKFQGEIPQYDPET